MRSMSNAARSFRLVCPPSATPLVEALLRAQGYVFAPEPFSPFCRRLLAEPRPLGSSLAAFFGYIYIQDRSSMLPPLALNPAPGAAVLDMCASPGSKTGFLAQLTGPTGFVLGNEPTPARLGTLRANLHQMNLLHAATCAYSGDALPLRPQSWRAILLDPPCSGWGTAAKHPQVLRLWRGDKIDNLTALQRRLLRQAARLLAQGGRLVYSTCTTNTAENEAQVHFAEEELGLVRVPLPPFPGFVWEEQPGGEGTLRVDGERSGAQGFYVALLEKPGTVTGPLRDVAAPDAAVASSGEFSAPPDAGPRGGRAPRRHGNRAVGQPLGQELPRTALDGPAGTGARLPPGAAVVFGDHVRFVPEQAPALLPPELVWQGGLLGRRQGSGLDPAPRLRALLPERPEPRASLVLDTPEEVTALLSGQSRQTGLGGRWAALWWRDLPLGLVALKQGRAVAGFR